MTCDRRLLERTYGYRFEHCGLFVDGVAECSTVSIEAYLCYVSILQDNSVAEGEHAGAEEVNVDAARLPVS